MPDGSIESSVFGLSLGNGSLKGGMDMELVRTLSLFSSCSTPAAFQSSSLSPRIGARRDSPSPNEGLTSASMAVLSAMPSSKP